MSHPKDGLMIRLFVFNCPETFTEERQGKKWTSKTVKYESFRYS